MTGRITKWVGGRRPVAASVTTLLVALLLVPFGLLLVSLATNVTALVRELLASSEARQAIEKLAAPDTAGQTSSQWGRWLELAQAHGATAWLAAQRFAGASAWVIVILLVFFVTLYQCLVAGRASWQWLSEHSPLRSETMTRLATAFIFRRLPRGVIGLATKVIVAGSADNEVRMQAGNVLDQTEPGRCRLVSAREARTSQRARRPSTRHCRQVV